VSTGCIHRSIARIDVLRFSDLYHWKTACHVSSFAVHWRWNFWGFPGNTKTASGYTLIWHKSFQWRAVFLEIQQPYRCSLVCQVRRQSANDNPLEPRGDTEEAEHGKRTQLHCQATNTWQQTWVVAVPSWPVAPAGYKL